MVLFNVKEDNSAATFDIALRKAIEMDTDIVVASTTGRTALGFIEAAGAAGFKNRIVIVTHAYGSRKKGENAMPEEIRTMLMDSGAVLVTAAHALSGGERSMSTIYKGVYPLEIAANTLRMISAGTKVCVEIGAMALDAGAIEFGKSVVCIGGTGKGADTACVVTPSYSASLLESRVNEFLCKPSLY